MNTKRAIVSGIVTWVLGVFAYSAPYLLPFIENSERYINIVFPLAVVPAVIVGAYFYYSTGYRHTGYRHTGYRRTGYQTNGVILGVIMVLVAIVLDALITVPLFIIPEGGNHFSFFTDPSFWLIAAEFVVVTAIYWRWKVLPNSTKSQPV